MGDRLRRIIGGATTRYALDLNNSLAQVLSDGSNTYLYGLDRIAQQNILGRQYYLGDALGSARQLTNAVGSVTLARSYEPFGRLLSAAGNPLTKYGYTGEWTDPTNLIYLRARYYDPATGRFLSKDPVRGLASLPQTLNPYTYAINNPIQYVDPSGRIVWIPAILGIGALVGGAASAVTYMLNTNQVCWNLGDIGNRFIVGSLAGLAGTGATLAISMLLPASLGGIVIGAISGGAGGVLSTISYNLLTGQSWDAGLVWGFGLGLISGGLAASLTPARPGPAPKFSLIRGWPLSGSYVGKKSIDVVLEEVTQDLIGAFLAIAFSAYPDTQRQDVPLPADLRWEAR